MILVVIFSRASRLTKFGGCCWRNVGRFFVVGQIAKSGAKGERIFDHGGVHVDDVVVFGWRCWNGVPAASVDDATADAHSADAARQVAGQIHQKHSGGCGARNGRDASAAGATASYKTIGTRKGKSSPGVGRCGGRSARVPNLAPEVFAFNAPTFELVDGDAAHSFPISQGSFTLPSSRFVFTFDDHDASDFLLRRRSIASVASAGYFDAVADEVLFGVVLIHRPLQGDHNFGPLLAK